MVVRPVDRSSPMMLEDVRHFLERQRLFGVVLLPPISENDALARLCDEVGCRYVRMGSAQLDDAAHMVASNDREAVREATDHLIEQGHKLIGLIEGPDGFRSARERRLGFEDALAAAGHHIAAQPDRARQLHVRDRRDRRRAAARSVAAADRDLRQQRRDGRRRRLRRARARASPCPRSFR